ncbi:MAG: bifunctional UDP-N-acetylglucosamine diphosphorylase/glucosamine-1-phosphate N-acetyltransferase GlmU [Betaproteobacteria bacterium]|nr:bifunctional UDP-N-acetylglucosamine diphosphorylase/glucosamine-1-phosphate N-acetyltransferase GlmU [Betaproteobacteria bacterium]MDH4294532.1 bifunctional UDP-N-acetylglucosamine diphosphorylase/glucosamine-1-phosphate N-acetyltransferase GlmU [Betaproteobacteria bacterium]MDH5341204.1 bifunctional UDP-N-acetylglucosamine diphosphorylase/glucosamine-1-phosphate N-acetyltransferase GlmU [Betaproteobacteria bacterium]
MPFQVVILAAGQGKRMNSDLPKVLHLLAGQSLIAHVIATARELAAGQICIVHGHGGDQVRQTLSAEDLVFALQAPQLGTGHALKQALPRLTKAPVTLVLYGDVPLVRAETLRTLLEAAEDGVAVLTAEMEDPAGYGRILRNRSGRVTGIVEQKDATAAQQRIREINTGIMALPTAKLQPWLSALKQNNSQKEYYLTDVIALAVKDRVPVFGIKVADPGEIQGVNSRVQLAELERAFQWRQAMKLLDAGVTLTDPLRFDLRGTMRCGRDVQIDVGCVFEGGVELADGVSIGAHCLLKDVAIGAGTRIEPFSHIDGAHIGTLCRIGPYARIRPGTRLAAEVHVGNFVEIKASEIGDGSKANHLAYVGDSTVGRNVNIGAGTITCNYDGANKHRTVIEDDVHIGSDVQLVAPVRVARGTTVGAGTTLWKNTAAGGLVINPKAQEHRPGWKRPKKTKK